MKGRTRIMKSNFTAASIDPDKIADILRACAAQYILPRFRKLNAGEVHHKGGVNDLVTDADRETEEALSQILGGMFPGSIVIGEEGIAAGKTSLSILHNKSGVVWVVDPVDGTHNFVHGVPRFAVMLSLVVNGEMVRGWIYDVMQNRMMITEKGAGTYIDGVRQKTAAPKGLAHSVGHVDAFFDPALQPKLDRFTKKTQSLTTLNCAGIEYLEILGGRADFSLYCTIKPWDHLAGSLAVQEAGGRVLKWDGTPYTPQDHDGNGIVSAANGALMRDLQDDLTQALYRLSKRNNPPRPPAP